uniref:BHLH domain-containing protein n=1 Tax=Strongyloides papillosus TaxID=174720 RepID=A0A0N5C5R1_STREA
MDPNKHMTYIFNDMPMDRKDKKPLMERKRRARMNESLNELKKLILFISPQLKSKLEKADILEITVHYFKQLVAIHANLLPKLKNLPEMMNDDANRCLKNEEKEFNMKEITNFQTPNASSFLSPPSSVSPDNKEKKNTVFSLPNETPSCSRSIRKRKGTIDDARSKEITPILSPTSKNVHLYNSLPSTPFIPTFFMQQYISNQESTKSLNIHHNFNDVLEQENKNDVWRPCISSFKSRFSLPCVNNTFHCGDGKCITIDKVHDSTNDCQDGSDEFCFPGYVKCGEICVEAKNADNCFGFINCYKSRNFPKYCPYLKQKLCNANGTFHCKGYGECIFAEWMFDKKQDCYDGSDLDEEYVSIFKKILNNQYPEELIYHLSNKEKPDPSKNILWPPTLWPNTPLIIPSLVPIITPKSNPSNSNLKPITPLEGLELMNSKTSQKAPLVFPTLIPYQITKSQYDNTEPSLSTISMESATINVDTFPIINSPTPLNTHISGHSQTTESVNILNIPQNNRNKLEKEILEENTYFSGIIEKNKSVDNLLETLKGSTKMPSIAFVEKATKQANESNNYLKIIETTDKLRKGNINTDDNLNYTYFDNIFGDEELITNRGNNIQSTEVLQQPAKEKESSTQSNTLSSINNDSNYFQTMTQNYLEIDKIDNKENDLKFLSSTTQFHDNYISDIFNENNNAYTTTTNFPINVPININSLLPSKETAKNNHESKNFFTTYKVSTSDDRNLLSSTTQYDSQHFLFTTIQIDSQNILSTTAQYESSNFLTKQDNILKTTIQSTINKNDNYKGFKVNNQNKDLMGNEKKIIPLTSGLLAKSEVLEDKFNPQNIIGKQLNTPQNWNFFGVQPKEVAKNVHSIGDPFTFSSKPIYFESTTVKPKESDNSFTTNAKINLEKLEKSSTTVSSLFGSTEDLVNIANNRNKQFSNSEKSLNKNINENISDKTDFEIATTSLPFDDSQKSTSLTNDDQTTIQSLETSFNQSMSPEEYNNCIKNFMHGNFHHLDTYGDSMCTCSPGETVGFLGFCQHKLNPIILKLHIEEVCGKLPSKEIEKRLTKGVVSLLTNKNNVDDVCFRKTKENEWIAEVFCQNCSISSIDKFFKRIDMKNKFKSKFYFTPAGSDACNDSELNFCDKNATCVPLTDKYQCICRGDRKNASEMINFDTDYGRNCHNNDQCDTLFGICTMYWLLLITFILFIIPCLCCLLYRICLSYNICDCNDERFSNFFTSHFKSKNRRRSKNLIIEDIKEAQKWHPEETRPSSVHSTENFEANVRRKSAINLDDDEFTSRKSMRSRTNSIYSVEDYMIVEDETINYENDILPVAQTKADVHDEPVFEKVEKDEIPLKKFIGTLHRYQSQPVINYIHSKERYRSLSDLKEIDSKKKIENKNDLMFLPKALSRSSILDSSENKFNDVQREVRTTHNSIENISSLPSGQTNKINNEMKNKNFLEKEVNIEDIVANENVTSDVETKSIKGGKIFHSKNSSSSLLSNQPIIEEEENEGHESGTFLEKLGGIYQPSDDILLSGITNTSIKSYPNINFNRPSTSTDNYHSNTISETNIKKKFFLNKKNASSASLLQHAQNSNNDMQLPLSLKGSLTSVGPSIKDFEYKGIKKVSSKSSIKSESETLWEHYQHDKELPDVPQTDSMDELEKLFLERLKHEEELRNYAETQHNEEIKMKEENEKIDKTENYYPIETLVVPRLEIPNELSKLDKNYVIAIEKKRNVQEVPHNIEVCSKKIINISAKVSNKELIGAEKVENMLDEITKVSDYNYKEDSTFINIVKNSPTKNENNEEKYDRDDHSSGNSPKVNFEKIGYDSPKVNVDSIHIETSRKNKEQKSRNHLPKVNDDNKKVDTSRENMEQKIIKHSQNVNIDSKDTETPKNINEPKVKHYSLKDNVSNKEVEAIEKNKEQVINDKTKKYIKKNMEKDMTMKNDRKILNPSIALITISKPSKTDNKRIISHFVPEDGKNIRIVDIKVTKDNKEPDTIRSRKVPLKPPIPKFTNLKVLPTRNNGPPSSRSVQEREKTTSPIVRSLSFNLNKSPIRRTSLGKKETEIKGEKQLPSQGKFKLPKIDEKQQNNGDESKMTKHDKNIKLPSLNKDNSLATKIKDHKKNDILPKVNPTTSNVVKERVKQPKNVTLNKRKETEPIKSIIKVPDKRLDELKTLKNIIPEKRKIYKEQEEKNNSNVQVSKEKKVKQVDDDDHLCNVCKHDVIQIHPSEEAKEQHKSRKIKSFIKQQEKAGILTRNPNTRQLSAIIEKSEEYKYVKLPEYSIGDAYYNEDEYVERKLPSHGTSNFDISRENSLIPVHFDSRYVGPPSARESARILENEGDYYAGDVDLDLPGPYILPVSEEDMRGCIFNNTDLRKLKTNIPFYDWDHHSEIVKSENVNKQNFSHSKSESNLEIIISRNSGRQNQSSGILNKIPNEGKYHITRRSDLLTQDKDLITREKSNLSINSNEDGRWNLAILHEGDMEKIPLPPLSYSYRSNNKK